MVTKCHFVKQLCRAPQIFFFFFNHHKQIIFPNVVVSCTRTIKAILFLVEIWAIKATHRLAPTMFLGGAPGKSKNFEFIAEPHNQHVPRVLLYNGQFVVLKSEQRERTEV